MKIQIRRGVFETNSSSSHSVSIYTEEEFKTWSEQDGKLGINGEILSDLDYQNLVLDSIPNVLRYFNNRMSNTLDEEIIEYANGEIIDEDESDIEVAKRTIGDENVYAISIYTYE